MLAAFYRSLRSFNLRSLFNEMCEDWAILRGAFKQSSSQAVYLRFLIAIQPKSCMQDTNARL